MVEKLGELTRNGVKVMQSKGFSKKALVLVIAVVCLTLILLGLLAWRFTDLVAKAPSSTKTPMSETAPTPTTGVCSSDILKQSATSIESSDINALGPIASQILTLPHYDGDINCDYVLARYYLMIQDGTHATRYINDLDSLNAVEVGYSPDLGTTTVSVTDLNNTLKTIQLNNQQTNKSKTPAEVPSK